MLYYERLETFNLKVLLKGPYIDYSVEQISSSKFHWGDEIARSSESECTQEQAERDHDSVPIE